MGNRAEQKLFIDSKLPCNANALGCCSRECRDPLAGLVLRADQVVKPPVLGGLVVLGDLGGCTV